jgi:hypothetical protein
LSYLFYTSLAPSPLERRNGTYGIGIAFSIGMAKAGLIRTALAEERTWLESQDIDTPDRPPAVPFLGFVSGTVVSLVLWTILSLSLLILLP